MTQEELNRVLEKHNHWLNEDCEDWEKMHAVLICADLRGADLRGAYLRGADLRGADLRGADLSDADLSDDDSWNECSTGIHFFINFQEAVDY